LRTNKMVAGPDKSSDSPTLTSKVNLVVLAVAICLGGRHVALVFFGLVLLHVFNCPFILFALEFVDCDKFIFTNIYAV
jgi:hypothetical protein